MFHMLLEGQILKTCTSGSSIIDICYLTLVDICYLPLAKPFVREHGIRQEYMNTSAAYVFNEACWACP